MLDFTGRTALVTGGSRGVGAATVKMLAAAGADVGFAYRSRSDAAARVIGSIEAVGGSAWSYQADLAESAQTEGFFVSAMQRWQAIDLVIINAGVWPTEPQAVAEMTDQRWEATLRGSLQTAFHTARLAGRLVADGGSIVFVSSTAGQRGEAFHADYAATKAALHALTKSMSAELGSRDINVNCVAPGWIDTDMVTEAFEDGGRKRIESAIPLGRVATTDDIAGPIIFLCSPLARHITGEILNINGGSVLCG